MKRVLLLLVMAGALVSLAPSLTQAQFGFYVGPRYRAAYRPYYYGGYSPYRYSYYGGYPAYTSPYYGGYSAYYPGGYYGQPSYSWYGARPYWRYW